MSEITEKAQLRSERLWEGCSSIPSLSQLAYGQPVANYDLLQLLSQAARAMLLLSYFNLRTHRPLAAFFDPVVSIIFHCNSLIIIVHIITVCFISLKTFHIFSKFNKGIYYFYMK